LEDEVVRQHGCRQRHVAVGDIGEDEIPVRTRRHQKHDESDPERGLVAEEDCPESDRQQRTPDEVNQQARSHHATVPERLPEVGERDTDECGEQHDHQERENESVRDGRDAVDLPNRETDSDGGKNERRLVLLDEVHRPISAAVAC